MADPNTEESNIEVLRAALSLAETQLLAQVADDASLDGRTTGLVGFNGALLAVSIAAKSLLGSFWWTPLPVVGLSTLVLVGSLFGRLDRLLSRRRRPGNLDLGKAASRFFEEQGAERTETALKQLLADLGAAFDTNSKRIAAKRYRLQAAIAVLLAGLTLAAVSIAFDRPTKMLVCPKDRSRYPTTKARCVSRHPAANTSALADR